MSLLQKLIKGNSKTQVDQRPAIEPRRVVWSRLVDQCPAIEPRSVGLFQFGWPTYFENESFGFDPFDPGVWLSANSPVAAGTGSAQPAQPLDLRSGR